MIKREKFKKYTWNIVIIISFYVDLDITFTIRENQLALFLLLEEL